MKYIKTLNEFINEQFSENNINLYDIAKWWEDEIVVLDDSNIKIISIESLNNKIITESKFIYDHITKTNPHTGSRDAFGGIPNLNDYNWSDKPNVIYPNDPKIDKEMLYPASKLDIKRYIKRYNNGSEFPPIVIVDNGTKYEIFDGLQAALILNVPIMAYIGFKKPKM